MKRLFCVCLALLTILLCTPVAAEQGEPKSVTIAFSADLHSYMEPYETVLDGRIQTVGGFSRRKTILDALKAEKDAVFVLDAGDFSMGTLLQSIYTARAGELYLMGQLGIEATTLGNHEFDFRDEGLFKMLEAAQAHPDIPLIVSANLVPATEEEQIALELAGVRPYVVLEHDGVKMAVFGLMGEKSYSYTPATEFVMADMIQSAKDTVAEIQAKEAVDMIVCLSHSGLDDDPDESEDEKLAKAVPQIDVIVSGHAHIAKFSPVTVGDTHILSGGEYGQYFGTADFVQKENGRWAVTSYSLTPITEDIPIDPEIDNAIEALKIEVGEVYLSQYEYGFNDVIAQSPYDFTPIAEFGSELYEDPLGNLIADSYMRAAQNSVQPGESPFSVALTACGLVRGSFSKGDITLVDVYNVSSLGVGVDGLSGYPLVSAYITGAELKTVAEIDVSVSRIMNVAQLYTSGLYYTYNNNRLFFNRVTDVWLQDENGQRLEIENDRLYRVTCGLYCAQMLSSVEAKSFGLLSVVPKDANGTPITDFDACILYNENGTEIKEWTALADYLSEMGVISETYAAPTGRKIEQTEKGFAVFFSKPNHIMKLAMAVVLGVLILVVLIVVLIVRSIRRRKRRKEEK
ncbi:MAG: bifunctional metallophosphatase/5'-nucleotidase [Clostridia bacterium]|nr:bifunctional metallophosphatase/5'-nucleotidase [Clostridia bacterium]